MTLNRYLWNYKGYHESGLLATCDLTMEDIFGMKNAVQVTGFMTEPLALCIFVGDLDSLERLRKQEGRL